MMGLNGIAAVLAAAGGAMYVIVVVGSILFGRKLGEEDRTLDLLQAPAATGGARAEAAAVGHYDGVVRVIDSERGSTVMR